MKTWQYHLIKPVLSWQNKSLKKWAGKESARLNLYEKTLQEISEYTGEPVETVREKHHLGPKSEPAFSIFQQQDKLTVGTVEHFYKEATYYLYELPLWNAERARPRYLYRIVQPYLKRYGCTEVLDFGGGTGDLCLELAGQGLGVTYCDIGKEVSDFARWRFARRNLDVRMCSDIGELPEKSYDAVISF
ncbi:MAG: class I SAM-dependent methyltransferase, partial [Candidatus Omnitrophica bacterium]|nr:class I SAM-dependent methyltransferase [Candidatus Omnitrophota bacterium]